MTTAPHTGPRPRTAALLACWLLALAAAARGEQSPAPAADALLKLIPAEADAVLAVDELRDRWAAASSSRLAASARELPTAREWLEAGGREEFVAARDRIMDFLRTTHREVRDEILGDAVVVAIFLPEDRALDPSHARGLLILKARKPDLLRRLVDQVNAVQARSGEVAELAEARRSGSSYFTRRFQAGSGRLPESFVLFPDGVFAFSNSEALVQEAIDRKVGVGDRGPSFAEAGGFAEASAPLAGRPLARAYVSPDFLGRIVDGLPPARDANGRRVIETARSYLAAMSLVGAALSVDDAKVELQVVQAFKPGPFRRPTDPVLAPLRPVVERRGPGPRLMALPPTAVAAASLRVNLPGLYAFFADLASEKDRGRLAKMETIADALLLGQDLRGRILPALGPRMVIYADAPEPVATRFPFPVTAAIEIDDEGARDRSAGPIAPTGAAIDNAMKGVLAALSLDENRVPPTARVVTKDGVTSLDVPYPFAFAIDAQARRLVVGTSARAAARYLAAGVDAEAGKRFHSFRAAAFTGFEDFACLDLAALHGLAVKHRARLVQAVARRRGRPAEDVTRDLDRILDVARLFDAAYLAGRVDSAGALVEHRIGLLPVPSNPRPAAR